MSDAVRWPSMSAAFARRVARVETDMVALLVVACQIIATSVSLEALTKVCEHLRARQREGGPS